MLHGPTVVFVLIAALVQPRLACAVQQIGSRQLIPRKVLFGGRDNTQVSLSPDGRWLSWVAASGSERLNNVFVQEVGVQDAGPVQVTFDTKRGVADYTWTHMPNMLLYRSDPNGREDYAIFSVDVSSGDWRYWIGGSGAMADVLAVSPYKKSRVVVRANDRHPAFRDLYELDLELGQKTQLMENNRFSRFFIDHNLNVRLAYYGCISGGQVYHQYDGVGDMSDVRASWSFYVNVTFEEVSTTYPLDFDETNDNVYWSHSLDTDLARLELKSLNEEFYQTGTIVYTPTKADTDKILLHPTTHQLVGVAENYDKLRWKFYDDSVDADFSHLETLVPDGQIDIVASDNSFEKWIISVNPASTPPKYYFYDRPSRTVQYLFSELAALDDYEVPVTKAVEITSRDGLVQLCYLTLPANHVPSERVPLVLYVHGGPWGRDRWQFSGAVTMFADRGYAALRCNFRASTGFGKAHLNAGNGQWGAAMHEDVLDAADWAVAEGITSTDTIAVFGISYGGYEALVSATFSPQRFACHLSVSGISNIVSLYKSLPVYWRPLRAMLDKRLGASGLTEEGQDFFKTRSPLFKAYKVRKPVLLVHGKYDARVPKEESDQFAEELDSNSVPFTYLVFNDEGHGIAKPNNLCALAAYMEHTLAKCLNGSAEAIDLNQRPSGLNVVHDHVFELG